MTKGDAWVLSVKLLIHLYSVVGRVSIVRRQRFYPVKTGGGPPATEEAMCTEEWLLSIQDLIDGNTRSTGLGEDLEAAFKAIVDDCNRFIEFPDDNRILSGDADVDPRLPRCIGLIGGTHVILRDVVPLDNRTDYIDSKRHISLNVQETEEVVGDMRRQS